MQDHTTNVSKAMQELEELISSARNYYEGLSSEELEKFPAPGKWSKKQIIGHLVDSAINNLKRFTDAQVLEQPYTVIGYRQNELMELNNYQQLPLTHILDLWQSLNRQIVYVVKSIPAERLLYPIHQGHHATETQTLSWLICDYVGHMKHHLQQVGFVAK